PNEIIGVVSKANKDIAEKAMKVADETFESWRKSDPKVRADILFRSAAIVRRRKLEFTAHLVKEGGKPRKEADADVAEGIDFLEYYGRQMLEIKDGGYVESRRDKSKRFDYISLDADVVISRWSIF